MAQDRAWLERAVALAVESVGRSGGPFGALVVRDGVVVGTGTNRVTLDLDPTAHAEVVAVREACTRLGVFDLSGATLYASCEPCPLCLSAALWSRLDAAVWAADRHAAARAGFDDAAFADLLVPAPPDAGWPLRLAQVPLASSEDPFAAWRANPDRVPY